MILTNIVLSLLATAQVSLSATSVFASLPLCAQICSLKAVSGSGCLATDIACFCKSSSFHQESTCCIRATCSLADDISAGTIGLESCNAVGVSVSRLPDSACSTTFSAAASTFAYTAGATTSAIVVPSYIETSVPSQPQNSAAFSSTTGSPDTTNQNQKSGLSTGTIAGIAVGVGVGCLGLGALAVLLIWRRRKNKSDPAPAQTKTHAPDFTNHGNELGGKGVMTVAEKQVWTPPTHPDQGNNNQISQWPGNGNIGSPQPPVLAPPGPGNNNAIPPATSRYPGGYAYENELQSSQDYQQPTRHEWGVAELPSTEVPRMDGQQRYELHSGQ